MYCLKIDMNNDYTNYKVDFNKDGHYAKDNLSCIIYNIRKYFLNLVVIVNIYFSFMILQ